MARTKADKVTITGTDIKTIIENARREIDAAHRKALETIRKRK